MRPTLKELHEKISSDLNISDFPHSFQAHLANSLAGTFHMLYSHTELELAQLFPDTAKGESLKRWGKIWGVARKKASRSEGIIEVECLGPCLIPAGSKLNSTSGEFETLAETSIDNAQKINIKIQSSTFEMTTSLSSKKMSFIKTISNVNPEASIISLEVGSSEETDEELRRRVLFAIQNPPQGGAVVDYINWVSTVPGVYRAFVRTASKENPGVVGFSFITKDLDQNEIIKDKILNKLSSLAPCGVKVEFVPLKFVNFPIKFSIVPTHLGTDAKIALKNFFKNHFTPKGLYGDNLKRSDGSVYLSELAEVLGAIPGEERYLIEEPKTHIFADEGVFYVC